MPKNSQENFSYPCSVCVCTHICVWRQIWLESHFVGVSDMAQTGELVVWSSEGVMAIVWRPWPWEGKQRMKIKSGRMCEGSSNLQYYLFMHISWFPSPHHMGFPGGSDDKESACSAGDLGSIPGLGSPPKEGNGNPLQYSCPENSKERGAWRATVHGVTKSQIWLQD